MTKWYKPYLEIYEKPFAEVPQKVIKAIQGRLEALKEYEQPVVSVVLICYNEETHIASCIGSLCDNKCNVPIEIIAINNNSLDDTENVLRQLGVTYYNETNKGPGYARQCGLDHARGKYHICIDADTIYPPHYIATHLNSLMKPDVVCTFSLWSFIPEEGRSKIGLWCYEFLRDVHLSIQAIKRPELCVRGMTFAFKTDEGRKFGFRTDIRRGEDGSLALTMKPLGKLVFIHSRKARVMTGYGTLKTDGSLLNSFKIRLVKALVNISTLFTPKNKYDDDKDNLI